MLGMKRLIDISRAYEAFGPSVGGMTGVHFSIRSTNGPAMDPEQEGVEIEWSDKNSFPQPSSAEVRAKLIELEALEPLRVVKEVRDDIIAKSDWTELPSVQATKSQEWITAWTEYRQALRDLPSQMTSGDWEPIFDEHGMIHLHNWPVAPTL